MSTKRSIRFIDTGYNTLFTAHEGDKIVIVSKSGVRFIRKVHIIDDCHICLISEDNSSFTYHIHEFAERMQLCGNTCKPLESGEN